MTFFEMSFEKWSNKTGLGLKEWREASNIEWNRIVDSLKASNHWHDGKLCSEVHPGSPR